MHLEMRLSGWKILKIINKPSMLDEPPHVTPKLQFRSTAPIPPQGKHTMATEESVSALGNDYGRNQERGERAVRVRQNSILGYFWKAA
jgi:hypothetical protein